MGLFHDFSPRPPPVTSPCTRYSGPGAGSRRPLCQDDARPDDVAIVAVNLFENWSTFKDDGARLERFLPRAGPAFSVVSSDDGTEDASGGVGRIPTVFVFGRDGRPVLHFIHAEGATVTNPDMAEPRAAIGGAL